MDIECGTMQFNALNKELGTMNKETIKQNIEHLNLTINFQHSTCNINQ